MGKNALKWLVLTVVCFSCKNQQLSSEMAIIPTQKYYVNYSDQQRDSLLNKAITYGDTTAYVTISNYEMRMMMRTKAFLFYALTMADKYNYPPAYFDVYYILTDLARSQTELSRIDDKTKNLALYYLLKAYEMKNDNACGFVENIFNEQKKAIPSSDYYLMRYAE